MTVFDLMQRVYNELGDNRAFWSESEVLTNGLDVAQRWLCFLHPSLLTVRTVLELQADEVLLDLRAMASRAWRPLRVALGDVTVSPPLAPQGRTGDLRQTSLAALRSHREWYRVRHALPEAWYPFGLSWVGLWPRAVQPITVTVVAAALPTPCATDEPPQTPDLPAAWHPTMADLAVAFLRAKEGAGAELEQAVNQLESVLGPEPLKLLQRQLLREKQRQMYMQMAVRSS